MELKQLEALLMDQQVEVRLEAARRFSQLGVFDEKLFVRMLGDADWRVRKEATALFLRLPDAGMRTAYLIKQLHHAENAGLRNAAIEILISLGAQGTPQLINQLASADAEVRKFIVDILGEIGQPGCVSQLLPFLQDEDENVRYAVVETLGKLRAEEAIAGLLDLLENAATGLRFTIFDALAAIGASAPLARILPYSNDPLLRKAVFACLGQLGNLQAFSVLLDGLGDPLRKTRETALLSIGHLLKQGAAQPVFSDLPLPAPEQLAAVVDYLDQDQPELQQAACLLLGLNLNPQLFKRLLPLLADEALRPTVVAACRRAPAWLLADQLKVTALHDADAVYLIYLAGELQCAAVTPLALQALQADDPQLRYAAVITLGKVTAFAAIEALGASLSDEIADIRQAAAQALRQLAAVDAQAVIRAITPWLDAPQADLRLLAVRTLGGLDPQEVEVYLLQAIKDVAPEVRCEALRSLAGGSSARLLTGLSIALTDENAAVRRLAATALAAFPASKGLVILAQVLDDPDPWVRTAALRALPAEQTPELMALLVKGLADTVGVVVIAALETLAQLFPQEAHRYLRQTLEHQDADVVKTAVMLLLASGHRELLFAHHQPQVRLATVAALQLQGPEHWLALFEQQVGAETDPAVRLAMEEALRRGTAGV